MNFNHNSDLLALININLMIKICFCFALYCMPRILANRQSAQRSRVRKLQYISELERSVTSLQVRLFSFNFILF